MVGPHGSVPIVDPRRDAFRAALGLQPIQTVAFDDAVSRWLAGRAPALSGAPEDPPEEENEASADERIRAALEAAADDRMRLYQWAVLLKRQDRLCSLDLGGAGGSPSLRRHVDSAAARSPLSPRELITLVDYCADAPDSPSWDLVARVWEVARSSALVRHGAARDALGAWTVRLIAGRQFHHDFSALLAVLDAVEEDDAATRSTLRQFAAANGQGAALIVEVLVRRLDIARLADGSNAAAETVRWLTSAHGAKPTAGWLEQRQRLGEELGSKLLRGLAKGIVNRSEHRRHEATGRPDELFWAMWKSACWHLGQDPGPVPR